MKSANTVVAFNCFAKSSGVKTGVATDVNAAPKLVAGNTGGCDGVDAVSNPAIGRFDPKVVMLIVLLVLLLIVLMLVVVEV